MHQTSFARFGWYKCVKWHTEHGQNQNVGAHITIQNGASGNEEMYAKGEKSERINTTLSHFITQPPDGDLLPFWCVAVHSDSPVQPSPAPAPSGWAWGPLSLFKVTWTGMAQEVHLTRPRPPKYRCTLPPTQSLPSLGWALHSCLKRPSLLA